MSFWKRFLPSPVEPNWSTAVRLFSSKGEAEMSHADRIAKGVKSGGRCSYFVVIVEPAGDGLTEVGIYRHRPTAERMARKMAQLLASAPISELELSEEDRAEGYCLFLEGEEGSVVRVKESVIRNYLTKKGGSDVRKSSREFEKGSKRKPYLPKKPARLTRLPAEED